MATKLQVLGTGCPKCRMLTDHTRQAAEEIGLDYEIEKVEELDRILDFGVVTTPALAVDGVVLVSGHVPTTRRLREILEASGAIAS